MMHGQLGTWKSDPFEDVISAFANFNNRTNITVDQMKALADQAHRQNPKHTAALKRRRKRKRGGPK